jgi:hypothetical protein
MEKKKTEKNLKHASLQTFILPDDFCYKLQSLEIDLHEGKLNHEGLKELFELYSVYYIIIKLECFLFL